MTSGSAGMTGNRDRVARLSPTWAQHGEVSQYPERSALAKCL